MQVMLANPRGFCAGVDRAIAIVERALEIFGAPIYVRHEVVHNKHVVDDLRRKGAVFVDTLDAVPAAAIVIFSAHGVAQSVRSEARQRGLRVFDATCPLVTKVHLEVLRYLRDGRECILIGHAGHPEVEGTLGQIESHSNPDRHRILLVESVADVEALEVRDPEWLGYVTQTTLSLDDTAAIIAAMRRRFPSIVGPKKDDICYATQNRQLAVRRIAPQCDVFVIVGSSMSSNSNRLCEVAKNLNVPAYLVDSADDLKREWFAGARQVGLTAGASAPEVLVQGVIAKLQAWGGDLIDEVKAQSEDVVFSLPKGLAIASETGGKSAARQAGR